MPDEKECECSWEKKAKAIAILLVALAPTVLGVMNHNRLDDVKTTQAVQVERAEQTKETLEAQTAKTESKLGTIEQQTMKTAKVVEDTAGPQLWSAWKYLEDVAYTSGKAEDLAKAKEARAAYENHLRKK